MEAAIGLIFNPSRNEILLVQRQDVPVWVVPGGGVDHGETAEEAVIREVFEETGLQTKIVRKVAEYTPINRLAQPTHVFECQILDGKLTTGHETKAVRFFSLEELPDSLFFIHKDWIEDAILNPKEMIKKPLFKVTYWALLKYFCSRPKQVLRFLWTRFLNLFG